MQEPIEIRFEGAVVTAPLEAAIEGRIARIEQRFVAVFGCALAIKPAPDQGEGRWFGRTGGLMPSACGGAAA